MRSRFVALCLIWGASFLFIKLGLETLAPLQIALGRMAAGTLVLLAVMRARNESLPKAPRIWAHMFVAAGLFCFVPFTLFGYAEQRIPSAVAAIGNATVPLFTLLVALVALPEERPTPRRGLGLALGFAGVVVVVAPWRGIAWGDLVGMLLVLVAAACYGGGNVYVRRHLSSSGYSSLALATAQLIMGTAVLALVTPWFAQAPTQLSLRSFLAVATLGALGTGVAYLLQYGLIREAGATVASMITYFIPVVSILIGVILLGERLAWNVPVGAAIIVSGAFLARGATATPSSLALRRRA
jgi:drug/metabolite transporter (DMT)-like permease